MSGYERPHYLEGETQGWLARAMLVTLGFAVAIAAALLLAANGSTSGGSSSNDRPATRSSDKLPISVPLGRDSVSAYPQPAPAPVLPHAPTTVRLHAGPDDGYAVVGTLAAGADLDIVGRSEAGDWVAVVFPPQSVFTAWLPVDLIDGLGADELESLEVSPVKPLPRR